MKFEDLTNKKYGRLLVLKRDINNSSKNTYWECLCDCGNIKSICSNKLKSGNTKSCGCYRREMSSIHGLTNNKKYNEYNLNGDYGIGYTSKGKEFYFDLEDYNKIKDYCWNIHHGYVETSIKGKITGMHRLVMNVTKKDIQVDHIFHNKNDNRKHNLRLCINEENIKNRYISKDNVSGVHLENGRWRARIRKDGICLHLGSFNTEEEAIICRLKNELEIYKDFSGQFKFIKDRKYELKDYIYNNLTCETIKMFDLEVN